MHGSTVWIPAEAQLRHLVYPGAAPVSQYLQLLVSGHVSPSGCRFTSATVRNSFTYVPISILPQSSFHTHTLGPAVSVLGHTAHLWCCPGSSLSPNSSSLETSVHVHIPAADSCSPVPVSLRRYLGLSSSLKASCPCTVTLKNTVTSQLPGHVAYSSVLEFLKPDPLTSKDKNNIHNMHILSLSHTLIYMTKK